MMSSYFVVIHKDEDSSFGAYFPDLPGCFAAGETQDQALDNARISLRLYIEDLIEDGKPIPAPGSLQAMSEDVAVKADLSDGHGFLLAVPLLYADKKRRVNVTLEPSLIAAVDEAARIAGTNRSDYLATAARHEIEKTTGAVFIDAPPPRRKVA